MRDLKHTYNYINIDQDEFIRQVNDRWSINRQAAYWMSSNDVISSRRRLWDVPRKTLMDSIDVDLFRSQMAQGMSRIQQAEYWNCSIGTIINFKCVSGLAYKGPKIDDVQFTSQVINGMRIHEQMEYWKCSRHWVIKHRALWGFKGKPKRRTNIFKDVFQEQVVSGMSINEQAIFWNCSKSPIVECRKKWGLKVRLISMFEGFIHSANARKVDCVITSKYLESLWESQNGRCPYTGWELKLSGDFPKDPRKASLDRIDSSKGYIEGNVQFVAMHYNLAKNSWTDEQTIEFCQAVAENIRLK